MRNFDRSPHRFGPLASIVPTGLDAPKENHGGSVVLEWLMPAQSSLDHRPYPARAFPPAQPWSAPPRTVECHRNNPESVLVSLEAGLSEGPVLPRATHSRAEAADLEDELSLLGYVANSVRSPAGKSSRAKPEARVLALSVCRGTLAYWDR